MLRRSLPSKLPILVVSKAKARFFSSQVWLQLSLEILLVVLLLLHEASQVAELAY